MLSRDHDSQGPGIRGGQTALQSQPCHAPPFSKLELPLLVGDWKDQSFTQAKMKQPGVSCILPMYEKRNLSRWKSVGSWLRHLLVLTPDSQNEAETGWCPSELYCTAQYWPHWQPVCHREGTEPWSGGGGLRLSLFLQGWRWAMLLGTPVVHGTICVHCLDSWNRGTAWV